MRVVVVADEEVGSPSARDLVTAESAGVYAAFGLEPPHPNGDLKTSRWGSTRVRIEVTGREAHAALDPGSGVSAIDELVDQLILVRAVVSRYDDVLCNVGTITGGGRTNVVPGSAAADIGFRFVDPETERAVLDAVTGLEPVRTDAELQVRVMSNRPAWQPSPATGELLGKVIAAGRSVGQEVDGAAASGAADTNLTGWLGVPTLDGLGPLGQGAHAVHEQVIAASLAERADLVAAIITSLYHQTSRQIRGLALTVDDGRSGRTVPADRRRGGSAPRPPGSRRPGRNSSAATAPISAAELPGAPAGVKVWPYGASAEP